MCVEASPGMASFAVAASPVGAPGTPAAVVAIAVSEAGPVSTSLVARTR